MTTQGLPVVSATRKVIFRVPVTTDIVSFPEYAIISKYGQNNSKSAIVVCNETDGGSWQSADCRNGVIIMNEVDGEFAEQLLEMYDGTIEALRNICAFASDNGYSDQYTTKLNFVETKLSPAGRMINAYTGIVKRDDRDICAVYIDSEGIPQIVINDSPRRIEADILLWTYRNADGTAINLSDIPTV